MCNCGLFANRQPKLAAGSDISVSALARSAALLTASPLGTALGGPLTTALGPRATLCGSGLATVALGAVACVLLLSRRDSRRGTG